MMSQETKAEEIASTVVRDARYRAVLARDARAAGVERKRVLLARETAS